MQKATITTPSGNAYSNPCAKAAADAKQDDTPADAPPPAAKPGKKSSGAKKDAH